MDCSFFLAGALIVFLLSWTLYSCIGLDRPNKFKFNGRLTYSIDQDSPEGLIISIAVSHQCERISSKLLCRIIISASFLCNFNDLSDYLREYSYITIVISLCAAFKAQSAEHLESLYLVRLPNHVYNTLKQNNIDSIIQKALTTDTTFPSTSSSSSSGP
jgi:hypothetical protein